jgi:AcrR family transcriptional regulator
MPVKQTRQRSRAWVVVDDETSDAFWGAEFAAVPRGLLTSAVVCFARNGYHATTTRDITAAVDRSPGALYVHFPSKEDVLFAIMRIGHLRALEALEVGEPAPEGAGEGRAPAPGRGDGDGDSALGRADGDGDSAPGRAGEDRDPEHELAELVRRFVRWHARYHTVARVCQYELAGLAPAHYEEISTLRKGITDVFRSAVSRGVAAGVFEADDVSRVVRAIVSLGIDLVRWYRLDGTDSPEELGDVYADLVLRMLAPRTG